MGTRMKDTFTKGGIILSKHELASDLLADAKKYEHADPETYRFLVDRANGVLSAIQKEWAEE